MTRVEPRPATAADAAGIGECVRAAYTHYVERIGKPPGPMLDDYAEVVRHHRAYVIDDRGRIVGVLVLMDKESGLLLDNVAVLPARQGEGIGRRFARRDGWLGGICAGIGRYFNIDAIYVRIAAVVAAVFFPKFVIAAYIIAWILLYKRDQP